jgi:hypothetical protein
MQSKLSILEKFLRKNNLANEAEMCHALVKLSTPLIPDPFSGEKIDFKFKKKDLKNKHGWIYVLKTEPTIESSAPYAWYVGETIAPVIRWIEHSFGMQKVNEEYTIPDPSQIQDAIQADMERGSGFTSRHKVLELICIELIDYDESVSSHRARKEREKEVFLTLAEFVGSANIGGNYPSMMKAKTLGFPPKSTDELEIKAFIKSIVNCNTGDVLVSALKDIKYEDITESDISVINNRKLWSVRLRKRRAEAMQRASAELESMSAEEKESYKDYIESVVRKHETISDILQELGLKKMDFIAMAKILGIKDKELGEKRNKDKERERENIIKALRESETKSQAKRTLGYSQNNMTLERKMKAYNISREELGREYQRPLPSDDEIQNVINVLRSSRSFAVAYRNLGMTIHNLEKFMELNGISKDQIGMNFREEKKRRWRELEKAERERVNALNNSRTIEEEEDTNFIDPYLRDLFKRRSNPDDIKWI